MTQVKLQNRHLSYTRLDENLFTAASRMKKGGGKREVEV